MVKRLFAWLMAGCLLLGGNALAEEEQQKATFDFAGLEPYFNVVELHTDGADLCLAGENYVVARKEGRTGVMNHAGIWTAAPNFNDIGAYAGGLAPAQQLEFGQYGYIDRAGHYVIAPQFSSARAFADGIAVVEIYERYAYINTRGEILKLLEPGWVAQDFSEGVAWMYHRDTEQSTSQYVLLDTGMRELYTTSDYEGISDFSNGFATASTASESFYEFPRSQMLQLTDGKVTVTEWQQQGVVGSFVDGYAFVMVDWENVGVIDASLSWVFSPNDKVYVLPIGNGVFFSIEQENQEVGFFVDASGKRLGGYQGPAAIIGGYGGLIRESDKDKYFVLQAAGEDRYYLFLPKDRTEAELPLIEPKEKIVAPAREPVGVVAFRPGDGRVVVNGVPQLMDDLSFEPAAIVDDSMMVPTIALDMVIPYGRYGWYETPTWIAADGIRIAMRQEEAAADVTIFDTTENEYMTKTVDLPAVSYKGKRTSVIPMRPVFETLGWTVYWDGRGMALASDTIADLSAVADDYWAAFEDRVFAPQDYPVIDGSTATIPMSAAMTAKLLGISAQQAQNLTSHNKTITAFDNLFSGQSDVLLTVSPDEEIQKKADDAGVTLDVAPLAKEGFVFLVNRDNPVDSLTVEQIRDIYTGKITNWNQVGGSDAPIVAFQRNADSGSQTIMRNMVMQGLEMMPAQTHQVQTMMGLVDQVADFDAAVNSIGYSVYYYFSQMHNRDEVKLLKVDGVAPNDENIRSGAYPFIVDYAVVIRGSEPANSHARQIFNWIQSAQGRKIVRDTGFVAVE